MNQRQDFTNALSAVIHGENIVESKMDLADFIHNNSLSVIVKPNAPNTKVIGYDENKKAVRIAVAAVPDKDKANKELVKFVSKVLGKKVEIVRGVRSRDKVLKIFS